MKFFASFLIFRRSVGLHLMEVSAHMLSPSSHLPTTSGLSCCLSPSVLLLLFQVSALQQDQALWGCFCSLSHQHCCWASLLTCHHISFSVFWAWQPLEMHSLWKEGKDLVIQSLQSESKSVPSSEALWQLFASSWHLPFNEMSPFVSSESGSNQPARMWGHVPAMRKDKYTSEQTIFFSFLSAFLQWRCKLLLINLIGLWVLRRFFLFVRKTWLGSSLTECKC